MNIFNTNLSTLYIQTKSNFSGVTSLHQELLPFKLLCQYKNPLLWYVQT